jgi:hypothetical protein
MFHIFFYFWKLGKNHTKKKKFIKLKWDYWRLEGKGNCRGKRKDEKEHLQLLLLEKPGGPLHRHQKPAPRRLGKMQTQGELSSMWYSHRQPWARSA